MSKIIAVWGSPSSGKTTTSAKIAFELANKTSQDTILLSNDCVTPTVPVFFPHLHKGDDIRSIGKVLQQPDIAQNDILDNCIVISKNIPLIIAGYNYSENVMTYPSFNMNKATELVLQLSQMAEFVVIDCTCNINNDELTKAALMQADIVIQLYKPEARSEVFFASQRSILANENFSCNDFVKIMRMGISKKLQATSEMQNIGNIKYTIPYSYSLTQQYECAEMFQSLADESYNKAIKKIIDEVIINATSNG